MSHTADVTLVSKTINLDGSIQVTFSDGTGLIYGDEASLDIDCEVRDLEYPEYLKSMLICMLANTGNSVIGRTLHIDVDAADGNIVKVV